MSSDVPQPAETALSTMPKPAVRHAEKRRIATCTFADRIATAALGVYRRVVAEPRPHPTCVTAILVYNHEKDDLTVVALGVGTKFLSDTLLREEVKDASTSRQEKQKQQQQSVYGRRVRDLHAEVLCRRAFRRYLSERFQQDIQPHENDTTTMDDFWEYSTDKRRWRLRSGYTLHAYLSSTPCGNATVKKFATLSKEHFQADLPLWPTEPHQVQTGHSVHLGQFALLLKKDVSAARQSEKEMGTQMCASSPRATDIPTQNVPAGTSAVNARQGSLHTCSDKICRWNYLGWQGSLLASLVESPLHMTTLTVGRKFSRACLQRAVCCRLDDAALSRKVANQRRGRDSSRADTQTQPPVHHPSVMCTAVYVEPDAVVIPQTNQDQNDMQFTDTRAFVWWLGLTQAQCLDATTGWVAAVTHADDVAIESPVSTRQLTEIFQQIQQGRFLDDESTATTNHVASLTDLRAFKQQVSSTYEARKEEMFQHPVMRMWVRRSAYLVESPVSCPNAE